MNENTGVIRLDTLDQSAYWIDRHGNQHELTDMTQGYLENVLSHLRDGAYGLYGLEIRRRESQMFLAEMNGWENGADCSVLRKDPAAAGEWLETTPLVAAIRTVLEDRGQ